MRVAVWILLVTVLDESWLTLQQEWGYSYKPLSGQAYNLTHTYIFQELNPRSAVVCPQGAFIKQISYSFLAPKSGPNPHEQPRPHPPLDGNQGRLDDARLKFKYVNEEHELPQVQIKGGNKKKYVHDKIKIDRHRRFIHRHLLGKNGVDSEVMLTFDMATHLWNILHQSTNSNFYPQVSMFLSEHGVCGSLLMCIGYQACLFYLSNEFCLNDPMPGQRKILKVDITCEWDSKYSELVKKNSEDLQNVDIDKLSTLHHPDYVMYLSQKSNIAIGVRDYQKTVIKQEHILEAQVFYPTCPSVKDAVKNGYGGQCDRQPPLPDQISRNLWTILGRIGDPVCRKEITAVYCAYAYSHTGNCVPPFLLGKDNRFNVRSLPARGSRPDTPPYKPGIYQQTMSLIPAKLAFLILGHQAPESLMELLGLVYDPQHFYVFHIDYRADSVRRTLAKRIKKHYGDVANIRILPKEKSFASSWGSFEIVRSIMEGFEALLQLGFWDFVINLSGSDLPLRSVSDIAATLAPYRGKNFLRINSEIKFETDWPVHFAWHSCNHYVYNVTQREKGLGKVYSHSTWGVLDREFIDYAMHEGVDTLVDMFRFYLQSSLIPDETYIGTILHMMDYKDTLISSSLHYIKEFEGMNMDYLCRHNEEADTCGMGPRNFEPHDIMRIGLAANRYLFARKFSTEKDDHVRWQIVADVRSNKFQGHMEMQMGLALQRRLTQQLVDSFMERTGERGVVLINVNNFRVLPKLHATHPCCASAVERDLEFMHEYIYWIDFTMKLRSGTIRPARGTIEVQPSSECYPAGHIRVVHITTRGVPPPPNAPPNHPPEQLKREMPIPIHPMGGNLLWLNMELDIGSIPKQCADEKMKSMASPIYAEFGLKNVRTTGESLTLDIVVLDPHDVPRCHDLAVVELNPKTMDPKMNSTIFARPVACPIEVPGWWTIRLREKNTEYGFVYRSRIYVSQPNIPIPEAVMKQLWHVGQIMLLDEHHNAIHAPKVETKRLKDKEVPAFSKERLNKHSILSSLQTWYFVFLFFALSAMVLTVCYIYRRFYVNKALSGRQIIKLQLAFLFCVVCLQIFLYSFLMKSKHY